MIDAWVVCPPGLEPLCCEEIRALGVRSIHPGTGGVACALSTVVVLLNRGIIRALGGEPAYAAEIANRIADFDLTATVEIAPDEDKLRSPGPIFPRPQGAGVDYHVHALYDDALVRAPEV